MADPVAGYLTSDEAAEVLGVKKATLYTYASRGLIRMVPAVSGKQRLYLASDVERLRTRAAAHRGDGPAAAGALDWGEPVIDSAITSIDPDGPNYRGVPALELVERGARWEEAAELLWTGERLTPPWLGVRVDLKLEPLAELIPATTSPLPVLQLALAALAVADPLSVGAPPAAELARARATARRLVGALALAAPRSADWRGRVEHSLRADTAAVGIARAAGLDDAAGPAIDAALVLCADHELNASAFAARVAASAGCDLYASVAAALAALTGPKHGGACDRVEALVDEVGRPERAAEVIGARLRRGEVIPGFGHPLYPAGDPRAEPLLARASGSDRPRARAALALAEAMRAAGHPAPTLDLGLVAVAGALDLPRGWAAAVFAIGRFAGWVAHAREQREQATLLRPRARYVGV